MTITPPSGSSPPPIPSPDRSPPQKKSSSDAWQPVPDQAPAIPNNGQHSRELKEEGVLRQAAAGISHIGGHIPLGALPIPEPHADPVVAEKLAQEVATGLAVGAPLIENAANLSQKVAQAPRGEGESGNVRLGMQCIGLSVYSVLEEMHGILDVSFLEQISPAVGVAANFVGVGVGIAKVGLGVMSAVQAAAAYKEAKSELARCETVIKSSPSTIEGIKSELEEAREALATAQEKGDTATEGICQRRIANLESQLEAALRSQEGAKVRSGELSHKMSSAKTSLLIGAAGATSGMFFAAGSLVKMGADIATLSSKISAGAAAGLHVVGSVLGSIAGVLGLALSVVGITRLCKALISDQKKLGELTLRQEELAKMVSAHPDSEVVQRFAVMESKKLALEKSDILAERRLHLISLAVNMVTFIGSAAAVAALFVAPPLATVVGIASIAILGLSIAGEVYVLLQERRAEKAKKELQSETKEVLATTQQTLTQAFDNAGFTEQSEEMQHIADYLDIDPKERPTFLEHCTSFFQAHYGELQKPASA